MPKMYEFRPWDPVYDLPPALRGPHDSIDPEIEQELHESFRDDVEAVRPLLLDELERADAPFTGKATACVLTTYDGIYSGRAEERGMDQLITAPAMALAKLNATEPPSSKLHGIYVMGRDIRKEKHVMPSPVDYDALSERFTGDWGPQIIIVSADTNDYRTVWAKDHGKTYGVKQPSNFLDLLADDVDPHGLRSMIQSITKLKFEDSYFITNLVYAGETHGLEIYLVGSSSGRGEISNALKDDYSDIDLLVVGEQNIDEIKAKLKKIAEYHYGPMHEESMIAHDWSTGREVPGIFLYSADRKTKIQLHIGHAMEEINFRPNNFERNYFHRVS